MKTETFITTRPAVLAQASASLNSRKRIRPIIIQGAESSLEIFGVVTAIRETENGCFEVDVRQ